MSRSNAILVGVAATFVGVLFAEILLIMAGALILTLETKDIQPDE
jgi:hypothetical protein